MHVRITGSGPSVLWIHGLGESGRCFASIVRHPALVGWTHIVPDLVGYGHTPAPASPRGLVDHAEDLGAQLRTAWAAPAHVVGHSMGAIVALELAQRHPACLRSLADVEGNKTLGDCSYSGRAAPVAVHDFVAGGFASLIDQIAAAHDDRAHRGYVQSLRLADAATFHRNSGELVTASSHGQLATRLAGLPIPRTYLPGVDATGGAPEESIAAVRRAGVSVRPVGPSGHWPFIDAPNRFATALADWWREVG